MSVATNCVMRGEYESQTKVATTQQFPLEKKKNDRQKVDVRENPLHT